MIVRLNGQIIADEWAWVYEFFQIPYACPKQLRDALDELSDGEGLIVEINSPGGSVWAGFEMYGILRGCRRETEAHIVALAASAATTVMIACDRVLASPVAQIMIHQPSADPGGAVNNEGARELMQFLDSIKASILNGYELKCGGKTSRRKLEQLVDASTWMPAQDAIVLGLVDGLLDAEQDAEESLAVSAGKVTGVQNAAAGVADEDLVARYEEAVRNGAKPVDGHPVTRLPEETPGEEPAAPMDWRAGARIQLERERCFG